MVQQNNDELLEITVECVGTNKGRVPQFLIKAGLLCVGGLLIACFIRSLAGLYVPQDIVNWMLVLFVAAMVLGFNLRYYSKYTIDVAVTEGDWEWENDAHTNLLIRGYDETRESHIAIFDKIHQISSQGAYKLIKGTATTVFRDALKMTMQQYYGTNHCVICSVCVKVKE
jgi:hypothetical protein